MQSKTDKFIAAAKLVFGNRFGYDHVEYKTNAIPVQMKCYAHGDFHQAPKYHLRGMLGCNRTN